MTTLLVFFFLCFMSVTVGAGTLYMLGFKESDDPIFFASPLFALCVWSILLGIGISTKIPVRILTYWIWGINLFFCLVAFRFFSYEKFLSAFIGCMGITLFICFPYVIHGFGEYTGSPHPDGWSYIAFGQYLWEYPRCLEGGLAPLYQYAAHLCQTRFITGGILGLFSPFGIAGDIQSASGYFFPWAFFVYASACMYFIRKHMSTLLVWGYIFLCVVSGWLLTIMSSNNFDQALTIGFLPVIAAVIESMDFTKKKWGLLLALIFSSIFYIYPEMTPMIFASGFFLLIYRIVRDRVQITPIIRLGGIFILAFGPLVSVYAQTWFNFIQAQLSSAQATVRPGGAIASELVTRAYWLLGVWGLANGIDGLMKGLSMICALALSIFYVSGFLILFLKNKNWGMVIVQLFIGAITIYFIAVQRYGYGAYKLITLLWWLVSYTLILAVEWLWAKSRPRLISVSSKWIFAIMIIIVAGANFTRAKQYDDNLSNQNIAPYKDLQSIQSIVHNSPVGVSVLDPTASLWAIYYLRDSITHFFFYQSYPNQPHVLPFMGRARKVEVNEIQYLLLDSTGFTNPGEAEMVWHNSIYSLWRIGNITSYIASIENPNGLETVNGKFFFWLGDKATKIIVFAPSSGQVDLTGKFSSGPSLPEFIDRRISVRTDSGYENELNIIEDQHILLPVHKGQNEVIIQALDEPTQLKLSNGDSRILLIGVFDLRMIFQNANP